MKKHFPAFLLLLVAVLLSIDIVTRVVVQPVEASGPTYKVVEAIGRGGSVTEYENLLNDMASKGWEFQSWLYRGSAQTPDLIFKKR